MGDDRDASAAPSESETPSARPGWVVLDEARDERFTGEIVLDTSPEVRVYLDRGLVYLAERATDPPLGDRLVDAGAINAAELDLGALQIGDTIYLGRLFERAPSVDRDAVLVITEMMTEETVRWAVARDVSGVTSTPYRHHESGVHRWDLASADVATSDEGATSPWPAPNAEPVVASPPAGLFDALDAGDVDDMIRWDEPAWLDRTSIPAPTEPTPPPAPVVEDSAPASDPDDDSDQDDPPHDWVDDLEAGVAPQVDPDLGLVGPPPLPPLPPPPLPPLPPLPTVPISEPFEIVWPSGEVDEEFEDRLGSSLDALIPRPATPNAAADDLVAPPPSPAVAAPVEHEPPAPPTAQVEAPAAPATSTTSPASDDGNDDGDDDVVQAVRRAIAALESTAAPAARSDANADGAAPVVASAPAVVSPVAPVAPAAPAAPAPVVAPSAAVAEHVELPSRVACRADEQVAGIDPLIRAPQLSSVFDTEPSTPAPLTPAIAGHPAATQPTNDADGTDDDRIPALRKLISSLVRR